MTAAKNVREALLPCPFCGAGAEYIKPTRGSGAYVGCTGCQASVFACPDDVAKSEEAATIAWNTRRLSATAAGDAVLVAEVTGADEYGPMLAWHRHWVDCIGKKLYLKDSK